jgi:hypothetical protein
MFQPDMVLTSAIEVGISIAGFTGIVIALSRRDGGESSRALLISILLLASIASVFFSFLPMLLSLAGLDDSTVWSTSSATFLTYIVAVFAYRLRQLGAVRPRSSAAVVVGGMVFLSGVLLQIPNVIWLKAAWPYLVLIVAYVLYAFSVFVTLLWNVWSDIHGA